MDGHSDEYDPLAPVYFSEPTDVEDDGPSDHTAADPQRIVRVWVEPDGELTRVQVSPIWHRKIGHRTLDEVFQSVLAAARIRIAPPEPVAEPDLSGVDFSGLHRFSRDPFTTIRLAIENVNRRWLEAAERQLRNPSPAGKPVEASDDEVTVRLDADGRLEAVSFDPDWLDVADVNEINETVLHLTRQARARYVPPEPARDELADLTLEHEILMAGLQRMLAGKAPL